MIYRFADCALDVRRHELSRAGAPVHVEPQVFQLLQSLVQRPEELVSKDCLVEEVWNGLAVSDATINARVSAARKAVGDDGARQEILRTVPRLGFMLAVPVTVIGAAPDNQSVPLPPGGEVRYAVSSDGAGIAWTSDGEGPAMVRIGHWLSHVELDRSSEIWGPLIGRLSARHRLIRYDARGTGLSQRDAEIGPLALAVDDLAAVIDASGVDRAVLVASSQAVPVALAFAARHPERVKKLALHGGYALGRVLRDPSAGEMAEETALTMIRSGWGRHGDVLMAAFSRIFAPDATEAQIAGLIDMQRATASPETAVMIREAVDRYDVRDQLPKVTAPVLLMHAEGDAVHPMSQSQYLAAHLPDARLRVLPGKNHIALPQTPAWAQMIEAIEGFLAEEPG